METWKTQEKMIGNIIQLKMDVKPEIGIDPRME